MGVGVGVGAGVGVGVGVGVNDGVGSGVGAGVAVEALRFEKPPHVPVISSYCQISTRPDEWTATARAVLPSVR